jgi:hypothetical protein
VKKNEKGKEGNKEEQEDIGHTEEGRGQDDEERRKRWKKGGRRVGDGVRGRNEKRKKGIRKKMINKELRIREGE